MSAASSLTPPYRTESIEFLSDGERVAGRLFLPSAEHATGQSMVVLGPVGSVQEQSPLQYATRLAAAGIAALTFDPRGFGASGGEPRQFDSPQRKAADVIAARAALAARPEVDAEQIGALGICMGCNWVAQAVVDEPAFARVAMVAGAYSIRERRVRMGGGEEQFAAQLAAAKAVVDAYEQDGTLSFHTLVANAMADSYFSWPVAYHWYRMWTDVGPLSYKGAWENRLATISDYGHLAFDAAAVCGQVRVPTLIVNSTASATPLEEVERLAELVPGAELVVTGDQLQTQFYDDPVTIDLAVAAMRTWLA